MTRNKLTQSIILKLFLNIILFVYCIPILAAEIPFGVTPKEINDIGLVPNANLVGPETQFGVDRQGNLLMSYDYKIGNRIGVTLEGIEYRLSYWNVGALGGTSGYLFWKKDYSRAVLTLTPIAQDGGRIISDRVDNSKVGLPDSWKVEPAINEPNFRSASCILTFSGGPSGTFKGTCNEGEKISGRLISAGTSVVFDTIEGVQVQQPLSLIKGISLPLNKDAFSDWKLGEQGCQDSGTRFNSISGTVKVASDANAKADSWGFARLETVLCVDDHVQTGEESEAILSFADMSTFVMKPETEIIINSPPKRDSKWSLAYGKIKANIENMAKDGTMNIEMSQAVAGIKGTTFILEEDGKNSVLKVIEGKVEFTSKPSGQKELVMAGEKITATDTGLTPKQAYNIDKELKEWSDRDLPIMVIIIVFATVAIIVALYILGIKPKFR